VAELPPRKRTACRTAARRCARWSRKLLSRNDPDPPGGCQRAGGVDNVAGHRRAAYLQPGALNLTALPPLSLYIHFPWCVRKCPYCDFNSHEAKDGAFPEQEYLDAVRADLENALPLIWGRKIYTIFIGGGTPSLMSARGLDRLLSDVRTLLPLDGAAEITMEANPGTFEAEKFREYRASGVNRLSIGIQSFNGRHLQALGRIHDAAKRTARSRSRTRTSTISIST
jgi:coproporphyrinogen III oxidase-like Fe-S oxidoreductase